MHKHHSLVIFGSGGGRDNRISELFGISGDSRICNQMVYTAQAARLLQCSVFSLLLTWYHHLLQVAEGVLRAEDTIKCHATGVLPPSFCLCSHSSIFVFQVATYLCLTSVQVIHYVCHSRITLCMSESNCILSHYFHPLETYCMVTTSVVNIRCLSSLEC